MTTKYRHAAAVAEERILELTAHFKTIGGTNEDVDKDITQNKDPKATVDHHDSDEKQNMRTDDRASSTTARDKPDYPK